MSVLSLQTLKPRAAENGLFGNSCTSSTNNCCNGAQQ
jgi:hypothetical protein